MRTSTAPGVLLAAIGFVLALTTTARADDARGWRSADRQWSDDRSDDDGRWNEEPADDGRWDGNRPEDDRRDDGNPDDGRWQDGQPNDHGHDHPQDRQIIIDHGRRDTRQLNAAPSQPIPPMRPYWGTMRPYWKPVDPGIKGQRNKLHPKSR